MLLRTISAVARFTTYSVNSRTFRTANGYLDLQCKLNYAQPLLLRMGITDNVIQFMYKLNLTKRISELWSCLFLFVYIRLRNIAKASKIANRKKMLKLLTNIYQVQRTKMYSPFNENYIFSLRYLHNKHTNL